METEVAGRVARLDQCQSIAHCAGVCFKRVTQPSATHCSYSDQVTRRSLVTARGYV